MSNQITFVLALLVLVAGACFMAFIECYGLSFMLALACLSVRIREGNEKTDYQCLSGDD